jgi:DNA polymerase III epsilon subunit-like protein
MEKTWVIVVDTETTGLPPRSVPIENTKTWDQCRIVQIAWRLFDENGVMKEEKCYIVKPDKDTQFSEGAVRVHGISKEKAMREGVPFADVFNDLHVSLANVKTIVAHNIQFDDPVIQSEMYRAKRQSLLTLWKTKVRYCTMLMGTRPGERWPKLAALYERLYDAPAQGQLHSADTDVALCADIYFRQIGKR